MNQQSHQQPSSQSQGSQQAPLSPPQPASVSLWCPSCGAENRPNALFCANCGARLTPAPQSQLSRAQPQGSQHVPPRSQPPRPKNSRKMSTVERAALIGAISTIVVAIVTYILAPVVINAFTHKPTPTATARPSTPSNVYPPVGWKQVYSDPMKSNSSGYWDVLNDKDGSCTFTNDVYQVSSLRTAGGYYCKPDPFDFTNFAFEVQMTITKGDEGAILFRANTDNGNFYSFWISPSGTYGLEIWQNNSFSKPLVSSSTAAINTDLNQLNTVAVVAQGNIFHLYVNDQLIDVVTDHASSFSHGNICLEAYSASNPTQVFFSNVRVWQPSS